MGQNAANKKGDWAQNYGLNRTNMVLDRGDKLAGLQLGRAGVGAQAALQKGRYAQNSLSGASNSIMSMFGGG
jgi:hypothetical protein